MAAKPTDKRHKQVALPPPKKLIGPYSVVSTIGKGRYGKVVKAVHIKSGLVVAIKILERTLVKKDMERIKREAEVMTVLSHPNIIKLYDVFETPEKVYIVMEYASGGDLFTYLQEHGRMHLHDALQCFRQIVAAILYCHRHYVVHRDLKPENIFLDDKKNVKVGDFGFARTFSPEDMLDTSCGSLLFAAPEVIAGKRYVGPKADVWSLGVILYIMIVGSVPFDGETDYEIVQKIKRGEFAESRHLSASHIEGVSTPHMRDLVKSMLTPDPRRRPELIDIQQHPWLWVDRSLIAMLVRPFAKKLSPRSLPLLSPQRQPPPGAASAKPAVAATATQPAAAPCGPTATVANATAPAKAAPLSKRSRLFKTGKLRASFSDTDLAPKASPSPKRRRDARAAAMATAGSSPLRHGERAPPVSQTVQRGTNVAGDLSAVDTANAAAKRNTMVLDPGYLKSNFQKFSATVGQKIFETEKPREVAPNAVEKTAKSPKTRKAKVWEARPVAREWRPANREPESVTAVRSDIRAAAAPSGYSPPAEAVAHDATADTIIADHNEDTRTARIRRGRLPSLTHEEVLQQLVVVHNGDGNHTDTASPETDTEMPSP